MARSQQRRKRIDDLLSASATILDQVEGPLSLAPIPGLSVAAGALLKLVEMVQKTRSNKEECLELSQSLNSLATFLASTSIHIQEQMKSDPLANPQIASENLRRSQELQDRVKKLSEDIEGILTRAHEVLEGNVVSRFFRSNMDADTLQALDKEVQQAQSRFQLKGTVSIEMVVNELIVTTQTAELDRQLSKLRTVDAGYRAPVNARKSRWLEGTRTQLLKDIVDWSHGHASDEVRANAHVFVLTGGAGTGKSTIAVQVAKMFDEAGVLGGSFFFERGVEELSSTRHVFPTLAVQLARSHKYLASYIFKGITKHQDKGNTQNLTYALDELIVEPLSEVPEDQRPSQPLVFVLDALDECSEQSQVPALLYALLKRIRSLSFPLRLFVTSRPEYHIQDAFASVEWESEPQPYQLTSIPMNIVRDDIKRFIDVRAAEIGIAQKLKTAQDDAVERLTDAAGGLFIFASTALEFLARYQRDLGKTLKLVLNHPLNVDTLDALYDVVLRNAFSENDFRHPDIGPAIPLVLGVLAVVQDQLAPQHFGALLQMDHATLSEVLDRLQSVLTFSEDHPIRLLHASFPQYLVDPERCKLPKISDSPSFRGHDYLARQCLKTLLDGYNLRKNICNLTDPLVFRNDIPNLNECLTRSIPPHVQYSCLHWATHLCNSNPSPESMNFLKEFAETRLLYWMEALAMLGRIDAVVSMLARTLQWHKADDQTRVLLNDGHRFVLNFLDAIKACPFHIYASGLPFSPTKSLLRKFYMHQADDSCAVDVLAGLDEGWGTCLQVMEGHGSFVRHVTFSHNGQWIASTSDDPDFCIWNSASGILLHRISGHFKAVVTALFSSDDDTVFSGSLDSTIMIWNTVSGAPLKVIKLDAPVQSMALSSAAPDIPQKIAVASRYYGPMYPGEEGMVTKILDIDGQILKTLPEGLGRCIDWSVDNKYFALAEREKVVVYNAQTYEVSKELVGHGDDVTVVKLFPQSDFLASGASDYTVRLWQLATQTCIHVFEGHTGYLRGIAINPQKGLLVSTALDRSMRVWLLAEKTCVSVHSVPDSITRLSFSPDGEMLVSGDFGHMLRSWDIDGQVKTTPAQSLIWVISPDGRLMAANTNPGKGEIEIWSTHDDRLVVNLGVDSHLNSLMASRDGPWFALLAGPTIYRINIVTQETSSLKLGLMGDGLQHPRWEGHILSLTGRGAVSSDGQRIYLQTTEYNGMVPFQQWYILDWVSQQITDVDQNNVPPVFSGRRPLQRYMQEPGWLIDRWRDARVCWLPPAFRAKDVNSCCLAVDGPTAIYFSVNGTQKITVLGVKNTGEGQGQGSDEWRTVYACIERVLGQGKQ